MAGNWRGYNIQLYQYAHRYRYNFEGCLNYFNDMVKQMEGSEKPNDRHSDFFTFGDFDLIQVSPVRNFRQYHDVSMLARQWMGKRQTVLLYDLSTSENPAKIYYDTDDRNWKVTGSTRDGKNDFRFFCLTMFSLTNEIIEQIDDISQLLSCLREKILEITDSLSSICDVKCEVFGSFNTSEVAVVWLSDQYTDILRVVDYIKHIIVKNPDNGETCPAFLNSFSAVAMEEKAPTNDIKGEALVQILEHDVTKTHEASTEFAKKITGEPNPTPDSILYSVGKYDVTIRVCAERAIQLTKKNELLYIGKRNESKKYEIEERPHLLNNIRLLYLDDPNDHELADKLEEFQQTDRFCISLSLHDRRPTFKWEELKKSSSGEEKTNYSYYCDIRELIKEKVNRSAGAVDTLDLLYTDYLSAISTSYSAMWTDDLHRQFKAVLYAIQQILEDTKYQLLHFWDYFLDLTNAFKQQIYHLSQSSQIFFEVPTSHLRATGQFDFLMHAYYSITKKILETIYLIQQHEPQSELVPLITVNTVPQVRSQLYFELNQPDDMRVVNLDIPNSVIFDLQRGAWYLTHELFHYAAPQNREKRNYFMGLWILTQAFFQQFLRLFRRLLRLKTDGTENVDIGKLTEQMLTYLEYTDFQDASFMVLFDSLQKNIYNYLLDHYSSIEQKLCFKHLGAVCSTYQNELAQFIGQSISEDFFTKLFLELVKPTYTELLSALKDIPALDSTKNLIRDRIRYCQRNEKYVEYFVKTEMKYRHYVDTSDIQSPLPQSSNPLSQSNNSLPQSSNIEFELILQKWNGIREACSDIAMISLNHISIEDYLLFCVQTLKNARRDGDKTLEEMQEPVERPQWLRFGLVLNYFMIRRTQNFFGWNIDVQKDGMDYYSPEVQQLFHLKYIWLFGSKSSQNEIPELWCEAEEWMKFFYSCHRFFARNYAQYYDDIFSNIVCDYDVDVRLQELNETSKKSELEALCQEFREHITEPYDQLFKDFPDPANGIFNWNAFFDTIQERRFDFDITTAQYFQKQKSLFELKQENDERKNYIKKHYNGAVDQSYRLSPSESKKNPEEPDPHWEFNVHSLDELLFYIQYAYENFKKQESNCGILADSNKKEPMIWFRGQSNEKYMLYPTGMRKFESLHKSYYTSLSSYHQSNYEEFKFRADGSAEMPVGIRFTKSDYIAMMQHYGAPSNFLDWTEDAFTSLYMALKYFIDNKPKDQRNVVLYIFDPAFYNYIRKSCLKTLLDGYNYDSLWCQGCKPLEDLCIKESHYSTLIPNLSVAENEKRFQAFLQGDVKFDQFYDSLGSKPSEKLKFEKEYRDENNRALFMPMAIFTSRLNPRIRTQNGNFIAFNLYTPKDNTENPFQHCALENIQSKKLSQGIFLYKIVIDKDSCNDIVRWLRTLGVSKESVYPELSEKSYHFD